MKNIISILISALILISCTPSKEELNTKIGNLETKFSQNIKQGFDITTANELLETYASYIKNYSDDNQINEIKLKAGELAMNMKKHALAVNYLEQIYLQVSDFDKMEQVLFFLGNIYENQIFDIESAEKYYTELIEKYPNSKYANDVKITLNNLGKTAEELFEELKLKNDSTQTDSLKENI
jgi:tetratricopeptide (TPR) repeat protein